MYTGVTTAGHNLKMCSILFIKKFRFPDELDITIKVLVEWVNILHIQISIRFLPTQIIENFHYRIGSNSSMVFPANPLHIHFSWEVQESKTYGICHSIRPIILLTE